MLPIKDGPLAVWRNFICKINIYAWDQKQTERPRGVHAAAALMRSWTDRRAQSCNSRRVSVQERRQVACDHRCPVCDWAYGAVGDEKSMSMPLWWCVHACSMSCRARHQGRGHNQSVFCPPVQDWCPSLVACPNLRDCQTRSARFFSGFSCSLRRAHQSWISVTQLSRHRRAKLMSFTATIASMQLGVVCETVVE